MKLVLVYFLPSVLAARWYTNDGWSAPGVQSMCQATSGRSYFCGEGAGGRGQNPFPAAFPRGREDCQVSGHGCNWRGASGSILCCIP